MNNSYSNDDSINKRIVSDQHFEESSVASSLKISRAKELGEKIFQVCFYS